MTGQLDPDEPLRAMLRAAGLRCTPARLDVVRVLAAADAPLTHREAGDGLPGLDRITVFRNLVALVEAGIAIRVDLGDHVWRYALAGREVGEPHRHPHFTCTGCGEVICLEQVSLGASLPPLDGPEVQVRGLCASCR